MEPQNYANHTRWVKGFHFLLGLMIIVGLVISLINLARHWDVKGFVSAALIVLLFACCLLMWWFIRSFPVKVQDRAIRAEESLRYFIMTGKAIDSRLTISQIIALRFAPDEEYLALAEKAAVEGLSPGDIKKAIVNWKADHHRA
jgi:hypothetical protein